MLIQPIFARLDPHMSAILGAISQSGPSRGPDALELVPGVYTVQHFNGNYLLAGKWEEYPVLGEVTTILRDGTKYGDFSPYGVCDDFHQILDACPEISADEDRKFCIMLTKVVKAEQSPDGGWRWHKWGPIHRQARSAVRVSV
jgi:hypothetical protein